ncbi:DUF1648 domain-containing protein [Ornithinibacillus halotolerans]|uniref:DUF1648 domain-containing protein n=1 Tax=Ornithinibacillus halotolerans TaxID=1274357 RepID=A0A916RY11_9BACI|nr:DUF1648 domain-containing protein [Ornithinibacillus halotolerans]GGA74941.1 hypothetical protein GCM10008025_18320 [Ornithinibacillus halotolerans]
MKNSFQRPKLNIPKTRSEWLFDIIGLIFYIGSIILLISVWSSLPPEVPAHYNALGEVDRWGSKYELLILPIVGGFLFLMMQVFEKYPEMHNYPSRLNESNAEQFYLLSRKLLNQLKNISLILFSLLAFESVSIAMEWNNGFGVWFLPLLIVGTGIPIVMTLLRQRKIK